MPLVHHELCFGCGRTNMFGLLAELEPAGEHAIAGRCFIKQDHQGPERGNAHEGVIAAALAEAISFAVGAQPRLRCLQIEFHAPVPVGSFLELWAAANGGRGSASARVDGAEVARASASYDR